MALLRNLSWLFVLAIALFTITVPVVRAQTTSITNLQAASRVLVAHETHITFRVSYSTGTTGVALGTGIADADTAGEVWVTGRISASDPNDCKQGTGSNVNAAYCYFLLSSSTPGSENFDFIFSPQTLRTYNLEIGSFLFDSSGKVISDSISRQPFSITVSNKLELDVHAPSPVVVTIDGASQSPGSVSTSVEPSSHTVSVPSIVQVDSSTRLRFDGWSDGATATTRTLNLQDDTTLEAKYVTQYRLNLVSSQANASGSDWYDSGSTAAFYVPSRNLIWAFQGWYDEGGFLVTASNSGSISMGSPHTLTARWGLDYILLGGVIVVIGTVVALTVGFGYHPKKLRLPDFGIRKRTRRVRRRVRPTRTVSERTVEHATVSKERTAVPTTVTPTGPDKDMFCTQCGAKISKDSKFCKECGSKQT